MHNDIMAAGSKEHPPMVAPDGDRPKVLSYTEKETYANAKLENKKLIDAEAEAVHMISNGIGNDIYSTIDACINAKDMWIAIERLQDEESINIQDVKTKLFWEFGKLTSRDGESIESYSIKFYKMTNEMRVGTVAGNRETVGTKVKYYEYHKEKMMLCKKESKGIPSSAKQSEWLLDTDEEPNEQELEAHYMYTTKIQEVLHVSDDNSGPTYDVEPLEKVHTNDDYNVFATERQHFEQHESINDTYVMEKANINVNPASSDMCTNEGKAKKNVKEPDDECVFLDSLFA
nr:hypothetical protein [Tanacetum cinerariifolium]